jgi:hypothetical protein
VIVRPLRWIIAAVLFLVILAPALLSALAGIQIFPSPGVPAGESGFVAFQETIQNLPAEATVLVVVDYQPGFAGEMEPAAGPVITQLMEKNIHLALISTSPMGSYLGERLIDNANRGQGSRPPYQPQDQYVNLGYLPGGAGSIKIFAEQPQKTVGLDVGLDGSIRNLWTTTTALQGLSKSLEEPVRLSDFAAIVVMTDNPDTGRLWIEQTADAFPKRIKPLLMVVSAQAEPLLRPYVVSGQVKGLLAGLEDGTRYENNLGHPGQARLEWDSFSAAILVTELFMIGGAIWSLVANQRSKRSRAEQDEA